MSLNLESKKLSELKEILLRFNLSTLGKKNELIERIQKHYANDKEAVKEEHEASGDDGGAEPGEVVEAHFQPKTTQIATTAFDPEESRRQARAKRFGLPLTGVRWPNDHVRHYTTKQPLAELEAQQLEEKKRLRAQRFGIQAMTQEQRKEARLKRFNSQIPAIVVDSGELEKRRKRAERFKCAS